MNEFQIVSLDEAKKRGLKRYYTGVPCIHGHVTERFVGTKRCVICSNAAVRTWNKKHPEVVRAAQRKIRGQIEAPTHKCPDRCELCCCVPDYQGLVEDHDHETGKFRGWLCHKCNIGLGALGDSKADLVAGIEYLERAEATKRPIGKAIKALQNEMLKWPQAQLETAHFWADGMYCRWLPRPATTLIVGKVHRKEHFYVVVSGTVVITDGDGPAQEITGPKIIVSNPGTKRAVYAKTDAICATIHRTFSRDLDEIEHELIENDPTALFDARNELKNSLRELE